MDFLLEPNIAYLILLGGILLSLMAIVTPGTGLFEVGAFFCLALAGYAVFKNRNVNCILDFPLHYLCWDQFSYLPWMAGNLPSIRSLRL